MSKVGPCLAALAILAACHPLDRRAPFAQPAYVGHHQHVTATAATAPHDRGAFQAGWGKAMIRAPAEVPLAGYGDRDGAPSEGVKDAAFVRAFALAAGEARALVFTADLLLMGPDIADGVRKRLEARIAPQAVFFSASHTHSGPGAYMEGLLWQAVMGRFDARSVAAIVDAHVEAAEAALSTLAPARIGHATQRVGGLIKNRVEKEGPVDEDLLVVYLEHLGTKKAAAFWMYGCHAVTLPAENMRISADYPGEVAKQFEGARLELLGFAAGGVGSSNPRHERPHERRWLVTPLVQALQAALPRARARARTEGALGYAASRIDSPPIQYRVSHETAIWSAPIARLVDMPFLDFGALAIDDLVLMFMPAEMSGNLTKVARARAERSGITLGVLPFNGTYIGYVVPRRVYNLVEEKGEDMLYYETHVVSFLGPWGADYLMNLGLRLAGGVHARLQDAPDGDFAWVEDRALINKGTLRRPGETDTSYEKAGSSN